jgi:hypothetical protein
MVWLLALCDSCICYPNRLPVVGTSPQPSPRRIMLAPPPLSGAPVNLGTSLDTAILRRHLYGSRYVAPTVSKVTRHGTPPFPADLEGVPHMHCAEARCWVTSFITLRGTVVTRESDWPSLHSQRPQRSYLGRHKSRDMSVDTCRPPRLRPSRHHNRCRMRAAHVGL